MIDEPKIECFEKSAKISWLQKILARKALKAADSKIAASSGKVGLAMDNAVDNILSDSEYARDLALQGAGGRRWHPGASWRSNMDYVPDNYSVSSYKKMRNDLLNNDEFFNYWVSKHPYAYDYGAVGDIASGVKGLSKHSKDVVNRLARIRSKLNVRSKYNASVEKKLFPWFKERKAEDSAPMRKIMEIDGSLKPESAEYLSRLEEKAAVGRNNYAKLGDVVDRMGAAPSGSTAFNTGVVHDDSRIAKGQAILLLRGLGMSNRQIRDILPRMARVEGASDILPSGAVAHIRPTVPYTTTEHIANAEEGIRLNNAVTGAQGSSRSLQDQVAVNTGVRNIKTGKQAQGAVVTPDPSKPAIAQPPDANTAHSIDNTPYFETVSNDVLRNNSTLQGLYISNPEGKYTMQDIHNAMRYGDLARGGDKVQKPLRFFAQDRIYASPYSVQSARWFGGGHHNDESLLFDKIVPENPKPLTSKVIKSIDNFGYGKDPGLQFNEKYPIDWMRNNLRINDRRTGWKLPSSVPYSDRAGMYQMLNRVSKPLHGNVDPKMYMNVSNFNTGSQTRPLRVNGVPTRIKIPTQFADDLHVKDAVNNLSRFIHYRGNKWWDPDLKSSGLWSKFE